MVTTALMQLLTKRPEEVMLPIIFVYIICFQVQDSYYGQQEARIGHFPSSVVEETHPLMPASTEVKTTVGEHTHTFTQVCIM